MSMPESARRRGPRRQDLWRNGSGRSALTAHNEREYRWSSLACFLDKQPQGRRSQWSLSRLYPQRRQCICNSVRDGGGNRNDTALACSLRTQWIAGRRSQFKSYSPQIRKVTRGWNEIIGKGSIQQLGILVIDKMVEKSPAEPLHQCAQRLAVHNRRVDRAADIFNCNVVEHFDMTGSIIDRNVRGVSAVTIGS